MILITLMPSSEMNLLAQTINYRVNLTYRNDGLPPRE